MAAVPKRAKACEKILKNKPLNLSTFNQAKNYLDKDLSPIGDMRASKEYRLEIAKNLLIFDEQNNFYWSIEPIFNFFYGVL